MKKQYLLVFVFMALVLGTFSQVYAETEASVEADLYVNSDLREMYKTRLGEMEALRERTRALAEDRKKAAEASGDSVESNREAMRLEIETKRAQEDSRREVLRVEADSKRVDWAKNMMDFQRDIAVRKVENTTRVMLATIERLGNIIVRIESRIAKVKAGGGITTESEGFVADAKVRLGEARVAVNAFAAIDVSSTTTASSTARENFQKIRTAAAGARELIRAAHQSLMLAVRSLSAEIDKKPENSDNNN